MRRNNRKLPNFKELKYLLSEEEKSRRLDYGPKSRPLWNVSQYFDQKCRKHHFQ